MAADGNMNLSNIETKFNLGSGSSSYDILSTMVTDSTNNDNKIKLFSTDSTAVFYGNAFRLGQFLIQFSIKNTTTSTTDLNEQFIYFPYSYSATPYTMFLNGFNQAGATTTQLINYTETYFSYTTVKNSYLNFMVIGPLPTAGIPGYINMNYTYDTGGNETAVNGTNINGECNIIITYGNAGSHNLTLYRPYQSITYKLIAGSGGGGSGQDGDWVGGNPGVGGGGGGAGEYKNGNLSGNNGGVTLNITVGDAGSGGSANSSDGTDGGNSTINVNSTTVTTNSGKGGARGNRVQGRAGRGGNGGDGNSGTLGGNTGDKTGGEAPGLAGSGGGWDNDGNPGRGGTAVYGGAGGTAGVWKNDGSQTSGAVSTYGGNGGRSGYRGGGGAMYDGGEGGVGSRVEINNKYYTSGGGGGGGGYANAFAQTTGGGNGGNGAKGICVIEVLFLNK